MLTGLSGFERALENESQIARSLRPPAQLVMTGWLGAGNERVYAGRDRWLFYRPDVEYVIGRAFLDPGQLRRRVRAAPEWAAPPQPDPRLAIVQFRDDLAARGITLVVMPTPPKPGVHPEMLARRYAGTTGVLQNASYRAFVDDLRRDNVLVFDPSEMLMTARDGGPLYLMSDTHWRPETMEAVAERLGGFIAERARPARRRRSRVTRIERSKSATWETSRGCSICLPDSRCFRLNRSGCAAFCSRTGRRGGRRATQTCSCSGTALPTSTRSSRWDGGLPRA